MVALFHARNSLAYFSTSGPTSQNAVCLHRAKAPKYPPKWPGSFPKVQPNSHPQHLSSIGMQTPSPFTSNIKPQGGGVLFEHPKKRLFGYIWLLNFANLKHPTKVIQCYTHFQQDSMSIHFGFCTWPIHKPNLRQLVHNSHIFGWMKLSHCQQQNQDRSLMKKLADWAIAGGMSTSLLLPQKIGKSPPYGSAE